MTLAGFTSSIIAAGSVAAGVQSGIGSVAAGSGFAIAQSLGATGAIAAIGITGGVFLGLGALGFGAYKLFKDDKKKT